MTKQDRESDRRELLTNIRRLTILVLDDLEEGMRERLLDQAQKRMLSSAGTRLLRLWRTVLRGRIHEYRRRTRANQPVPPRERSQ